MIPLPHYGSMSIPISPEKYPGKIGREMPIFPRKNALIVSGGVVLLALLLLSAPVAAQSPTPTPWPAIVATTTAAAQMQQQAAAQRAEAMRLQQQADAAKAQADDAYLAAQQATIDARAALVLQQWSAVSEALGRAESSIASGKTQIDTVTSVNAQLRELYSAQVSTIISLTAELQAVRSALQVTQQEKQTTLTAYYALKNQQADQQTQDTILNLAKLFALIAIFVLIIAGVISVVQRRSTTVIVEKPKQEAEQGEVIEGEVTEEQAS